MPDVTKNMKHTLLLTITLIFAATLSTTPLSAHEGHKENMTDAEMAQMATDMAAEAPIEMHDMVHEEGPDKAHHGLDDVMVPLSAQDALAKKVTENRLTSSSDFLGRLHPVAAHFPIALLIMAFLAELALIARPTIGLEPTIRFLVAGGAIGAVLAALLGWFAAGWRLSDRSDTLGLHRWNGSAIALIGLLAWWFAARGGKRVAVRVTLALLAAMLVIQGFLGGEMVFGPNHMGIF